MEHLVERGPIAGRYRLLTVCGAGSTAVVWRAHDEVLGREVAVKLLRPGLPDHADVRRRFHHEARAAARLSHPNIARIFDFGEDHTEGGAGAYVVMEYVAGPPFSARMADGPLPWQEAVVVCAQVADAMADAHANGVIHRDIKPSNVMVGPTGAKVVDFGISTVAGVDNDDTGEILGTPAYLAPERLSGGAASPASDVYGLGLMLFRAVAGEYPWPLATLADILAVHMARERPVLPRLPHVPRALTGLCYACLEPRPSDRPTMRAIADGLPALLAGPAPAPRMPLSAVPRRQSLVAA